MILFHVGDQTFAIDCRYVLEVVPLIKVLNIPHKDGHVAGVASLNGSPVTIFDFSYMIANRPSVDFLTTRIVMLKEDPGAKIQQHLALCLGLIVEKAVEVVEVPEANISQLGLNVKAFDFFDGIADLKGRSAQIVDVPKLFSFLQSGVDGNAGRT